MIFNSVAFFLFFIVFFILYWFIFCKNIKYQNTLVLIGSYFFYAWWDWRFLFLLIFSSLINYLIGIYIEETENEKKRKVLFYLGLIQGLGGLLFFKYYNFFVESLVNSFSSIGVNLNLKTLQLILPLGISFYTFRTISYLIDVYHNKIQAVKDGIVFFTYVAFFPSLLSGPIDKARDFVPQLESKRKFKYTQAVDGLRQILWGLFKKVVIANNCAILVDKIFDNYSTLPASTLAIGSFLYCIQLYADFSGYSDMAIGIGKLLGFKITKNFNFPFFSENIAEYWRKWHISLTSWVTEYVYTPLSFIFRDYGKWGLILAIIINFLLIGLWHGANWTFVMFGLVHGILFIPLIIADKLNRKPKTVKSKYSKAVAYANMIKTFIIVMLSMIILRVETISDAFLFYKNLFSKSLLSAPSIDFTALIIALSFTLFMLLVEWLNKAEDHGLQLKYIKNTYLRWIIYFSIVILIVLVGQFDVNQFLYFKF